MVPESGLGDFSGLNSFIRIISKSWTPLFVCFFLVALCMLSGDSMEC